MDRATKLYGLFLGWYSIGFVLQVFFTVPDWLQFSNSIFLLLFALAAVFVFGSTKKEIIVAIIIGLLTYFIEVLGVLTGFPFGSYAYSDTLGLNVLGVPFTLGFAWLGVIYTGLLMADQPTIFRRAIEVGVWVVLLDLILDPAAEALGFWHWNNAGVYYGIPTTNFIAWFIIGGLVTFMVPKRTLTLYQQKRGKLLFQLMVLLFGILGVKTGLPFVWIPTIILMLIAEGRYFYARSK
ncbi:carotenoid biosynthesis protein [Saliterribacillus persicus]|uniref:Putative membrane protein n=1 Tax=Saliterribacillus persicus TaxID=930114 RepID=A0A368Y2T2_9BACI|nr:carotenoid biosynthesis protein [Saliterribacillus persicus]RCW73137.1 putative membrane protein [Saliterribacillus persicus]